MKRLALLLLLLSLPAQSGEIPLAERRSGFDFMSRETQAMQQDDTLNPGMLWVAEGEALWRQEPKACAGCHQDAAVSMRGVAARYPAYDDRAQRPIDLQQRINQCRETRQGQLAHAPESRELLSLSAYIGYQSRGQAMAPPDDARLTPFRERGRALFERRIGQLNFSCAQCHNDNWGQKLGGSAIPQGHANGYPIYRLEWQGLGSLQRRLRNCMIGVRAEPPAYGAAEYIELELYLAQRAKGMAVEIPAVRP